jgi:hypothetical protein
VFQQHGSSFLAEKGGRKIPCKTVTVLKGKDSSMLLTDMAKHSTFNKPKCNTKENCRKQISPIFFKNKIICALRMLELLKSFTFTALVLF